MSKLSISGCISAGYSSVILQTPEENRALAECLSAGQLYRKKVYYWSCTRGLMEVLNPDSRNLGEKNYIDMEEYLLVEENAEVTDPQEALTEGLKLNDEQGEYILCMLDFHHFVDQPFVLRAAKEAFEKANELGCCFIFISNQFDVPKDWEESTVSIDLELPNKENFIELINDMVSRFKSGLKASELEKISAITEKAAEILLGMTLNQAENAIATSFSKKRTIDLEIISEVKAQIICKDGLLEFWSSHDSVKVGGMKNFKEYTEKRILAYSDEAKAYGLPNPKGVLLVGIPGCGKSLAAKALANTWNVPLIKCDLGKLFGSYVGDTETNTRKALQTAEAMAPCVLWIDEIEKGLAGAGAGGRNDSGVSSRMFASILTWMQEKKSAVYVIATANNITSLPPELLRKGRFDEIFFVGLPNLKEREEIVSIQLENRGRNAQKFNVEKLAEVSDGFTGAEIEEVVISAMFNSFADNARELNTDDILNQMDVLKPASKGIMKEAVEALTEWAEKENIRCANSSDSAENTGCTTGRRKKTGRTINFEGGEQ